MLPRTLMLTAVLALSAPLFAGCSDNSNNATDNKTANGGTANSAATAESQTDDTNPVVDLIFGTGGTSGSYYPIGGALKPIFEASDKVGRVQVVSTGASVQNIQNIQDGLNQIAIVMSDVAYDAINGKNQFEGHKADIATLAGLYPNVVQIVATGESGIKSIADLKGKRVGVGKVGSGVEQSAKKVLESAGLSYDDLARVSHTGYADSVTAMSNGNLDAAFFTSGVPNSSITGLMQTSDVTFVPVDGDVASKLLKAYPYYEAYTIPASKPERYNLDNAITTVAIRNILIVPTSMRDDVAQELTKRFDDYLQSDKVSVGALKEIDPATMDQHLVVPLHPGAKAYYDTREGAGNSDDG